MIICVIVATGKLFSKIIPAPKPVPASAATADMIITILREIEVTGSQTHISQGGASCTQADCSDFHAEGRIGKWTYCTKGVSIV